MKFAQNFLRKLPTEKVYVIVNTPLTYVPTLYKAYLIHERKHIIPVFKEISPKFFGYMYVYTVLVNM